MELTRRNFLAGITLAGAGLASAGLAACAPKAGNEEDAKPSAASSKTSEVAEPAAHNPESTESCDIVVVGSGTAGVCAAAKAAQMGAMSSCWRRTRCTAALPVSRGPRRPQLLYPSRGEPAVDP